MLMAGGDAAGTDPSCFMSHMSAGLPHGSINQDILHQHNSTASHPRSSAATTATTRTPANPLKGKKRNTMRMDVKEKKQEQ